MACSGCEAFTQAPLPSRPIERGRPGPGLLAHVLVSKYADHLPLYRQSQIFEREGLDLDRSTLADWVGKSTALLEPLAEAIGRHVLAGQAIFADDTPVKMLAPGTGKTATARLWAYGRDERSWGSETPPASWYRFSPDRKGQHPKDHLSGYCGWMHADGYAGFEDIYRSSDIHEVACMAHVRRKFVDVHRAQGSAIADEAIRRIAQLYAVEKEARGSHSAGGHAGGVARDARAGRDLGKGRGQRTDVSVGVSRLDSTNRASAALCSLCSWISTVFGFQTIPSGLENIGVEPVRKAQDDRLCTQVEHVPFEQQIVPIRRFGL